MDERDTFQPIAKLIEAEIRNFTAQIQVQDGVVIELRDIKVSEREVVKRKK